MACLYLLAAVPDVNDRLVGAPTNQPVWLLFAFTVLEGLLLIKVAVASLVRKVCVARLSPPASPSCSTQYG